MHFDLRTSGELLSLRTHTTGLINSLLGIELTGDLVLVALNELSDHSPDHVELLSSVVGHRLTKILKLELSLL